MGGRTRKGCRGGRGFKPLLYSTTKAAITDNCRDDSTLYEEQQRATVGEGWNVCEPVKLSETRSILKREADRLAIAVYWLGKEWLTPAVRVSIELLGEVGGVTLWLPKLPKLTLLGLTDLETSTCMALQWQLFVKRCQNSTIECRFSHPDHNAKAQQQLSITFFDFNGIPLMITTKLSESAPLLWKKQKNTSQQNELNKSTAERSLTTLACTKRQAENILKRNFNYFHPTSGCTAQSGRGALETWSESSTLLVVFCSTAESRGPWSSLANCSVPPHACCAIKDNCANDVQPCCSSALLWDQVNPCSRQKETQSPVMPRFHSKEQDVLVIKCLCEIRLQ